MRPRIDAIHAFSSVESQLVDKVFVAEQLFDMRSERTRVHPWRQEAVFFMNQPLFYSSRVESNHRQSISHCFRSHHAEELRPNGRNHENTHVEVELLQL